MAKYTLTDGWHRLNLKIDHTQVSADLTNFVVCLDLSQISTIMSNAGLTPANFWDHVGDGGSIRITKGDLTTELAREIVSCDDAAETGEVHFKFDGTLSCTADTDFALHFGKSGETDYAVGATYGAEAVWQDAGGSGVDFDFVSHDGGQTDSTANGYDGTATDNPDPTATGVIGSCTEFDGNDSWSLPDIEMHGITNLTISSWFYVGSDHRARLMTKDSTSGKNGYIFRLPGDGTVEILINDSFNNWPRSSTGYSAGAWVKAVGGMNAGTTFVQLDGNSRTTGSSADILDDSEDRPITIGASVDDTWNLTGKEDEVRQLQALLSEDFLLTEYNNQFDPGTFFVPGDYVAPGSGDIDIEIGLFSIDLNSIDLEQIDLEAV